MSVFRQVLKGSAWNFVGKMGGQVIAVATLAVLARVLSPEDFGLVAMTASVKALADVFANLGMNSAVIQRKDLNDEYLSTAFWTTIAASVFITAIVALSAPLVARFFGREELRAVMVATSFVFVLGGISSTHRAILSRRMSFKRMSAVSLIGWTAGSVTAITMATKGMGYWSLVGQELVTVATFIPLFWLFSGWTPKFVFVKRCFHDLFGFSSFLLLSNLTNILNRNLDNIIVGRVLGAVPLGIYDRAYTLMLKPLQYVSLSTSQALFPGLSRLQGQKEEARGTYLRMVKVISLLTFPMMTGLFIVADDAILLAYGEGWEATVPVFRVLCFVGAWQSVHTTVGTVFTSQARTRLGFMMNLIHSPITWIAFIVGTRWGIEGVAVCYAIDAGLWWIVSQGIANSIIGLRGARFIGALLPATLFSVLMGLVTHSVKVIASSYDLPQMVNLSLTVATGVIMMGLLMSFAHDADVQALRSRIVRIFRPVSA